MARYRNYSDDDKAQALAFLAANRNNYLAASRETGIPWTTLREWHREISGMSESVSDIRQEKQGSLADALEEKIWLMVGEGFHPEKIREAPVNALSTAIGTFVDKVRLLRDEPTEIHGDDPNEKRIVIRYDDSAHPAPAEAAPGAEEADRGGAAV